MALPKHTKVYFDYFGYGEDDIILCEVCLRKATDLHHIKYKSRGGTNDIGNIIALCRKCHDLAHNEKLTEDYLQQLHNTYLERSTT